MEILPVYKKTQINLCKSAGLDLDMFYLLDTSKGVRLSSEKWKKINEEKLGKLSPIVDFLKKVEDTKLKIEPLIYSIERELKEKLDDKHIFSVISHALKSPSWRERATLMNILTAFFGTEFKNGFVDAAIAVELAQEAFMIRDDILDDQERCVNRDTIPNLYGNKISELAKDILLSKARFFLIEAITKNDLNTEETRNCIKAFEEMIYFDTLGQWIDINSERLEFMEESAYFEMVGFTPGKQFEVIPILVFHLARKEDTKILKNLCAFGKRFGMAAQLRDDIIDIVGEESVVYKKLGTDIKRRKKRLPLIKYLENNPRDRKCFNIDKYPKPPEEELNRILCEIKKDTSLSYCMQTTKKLVTEGESYLRNITDGIGKKMLMKIAKLLCNFDENYN